MKKLKSINVSSVFRVSLILGAIAGVIAGIVLFIVDVVDQKTMEGLVTLLLAPILYGVMGGLVNALMAKLYNVIAARWGGIEITLD